MGFFTPGGFLGLLLPAASSGCLSGKEVLRSQLGERPVRRRHGRETRQRRLCGGPARPDEECRRGFAGRERSRGQA